MSARVWSLLGALLLVAAILVLLDFTVIGLPISLWLLVRWSLFVHAVVLEGLPGRKALRRSAQLVRGQWWRVAMIILLVGGCGLLAGPLLGLLLLLLTGLPLEAVNLISSLVYALAVPPVAIVLTYLFFDLEVRKRLQKHEPRGEALPEEAAVVASAQSGEHEKGSGGSNID